MKTSPRRLVRPRLYKPLLTRAFTLVELLVVIAIIALLAGIIFPVFARARENARATACLSNMKQLGTAISLYVQDYDGAYPMNRLPDATHSLKGCLTPDNNYPTGGLETSSVNWRRALRSYVKSRAVFQCPSNPYAWAKLAPNAPAGDETNRYYKNEADHLPLSYAYNGTFFHEATPACWYDEKWERPRRESEIGDTANLILLLESRFPMPDLGSWFISWPGPKGDGAGEGPFQSHNGSCNWVFADGHAARLKLGATCERKMWSGGFPSKANGCTQIDQSAAEYR